jgi:hypothetical protein
MKNSASYEKRHESSGSASTAMHLLAAAANLNPAGLARAISVAPSTVTRILHGEVCPSYDDMLHYAFMLGYIIEDGKLVRLERLRAYRSPKEIGDFVNKELSDGLDDAKLRMLLRYIPKTILDWRDLTEHEQKMMIGQPARINDVRFQALVEGAVQFYSHAIMWQESPAWTQKTRLDRIFVPRAALHGIGPKRYENLIRKSLPEFSEKNILFTYDEMRLI